MPRMLSLLISGSKKMIPPSPKSESEDIIVGNASIVVNQRHLQFSYCNGYIRLRPIAPTKAYCRSILNAMELQP